MVARQAAKKTNMESVKAAWEFHAQLSLGHSRCEVLVQSLKTLSPFPGSSSLGLYPGDGLGVCHAAGRCHVPLGKGVPTEQVHIACKRNRSLELLRIKLSAREKLMADFLIWHLGQIEAPEVGWAQSFRFRGILGFKGLVTCQGDRQSRLNPSTVTGTAHP